MTVRILAHPTTLPPEYFAAIGRIAAQWNQAEVYLQALIWHYLGLDFKGGRVLTYHVPTAAKIAALEAITRGWIADRKTRRVVNQIRIRAQELSRERNNFVHGVWGVDPERKPVRYELHSIGQTRPDEKILPGAKHYTATEVSAVADEIEALIERIKAHLTAIGARTPPEYRPEEQTPRP